jgi:hypothetical protein
VEVFRACVLEGRSTADVAAKFGIKENAVYQIKNRLMARLNGMVSAMDKGGADPSSSDDD